VTLMKTRGILVAVVVAVSLMPTGSRADEASSEGDTARLAASILRRSCARCHKGKGSESGYAFDVLDVESLADNGVLIAGEPDSSSLFEVLYEGRMPPRNRPQLPRPSAAETEIVKAWIVAGAPPLPPPVPRPAVSFADELSAVIAHLRSVPRDERPNWRYFTLANLHNDASVDAAAIDMARMALVKVLNSLSWQPRPVVPEPLGGAGVLLAIDISRLGWTREHWNRLVADYPYSLGYASLEDTSLHELDRELRDLRRDGSPAILRADWMVGRGSQPPLYYAILFDLSLPELVSRPTDTASPANPKRMTDVDLERILGVDAASAIASGRVNRAGFTHSGVSGQNRLVERHNTRSGSYYWKSYDFKSSNRTAILSEFPLGPRFDGNAFNDLAFEHDGGEVIFGLPNGLQGYLLVDGRGRRIDAGPIEVVGDALKTSGSEQIVAGVSCIACHRHGMIETPDDEIRSVSGVVAEARDHLRRIYPETAEFRRLIDADTAIFVSALDRIMGPVPGGGSVADLPEPVGETARDYLLEPVRLETAAAELSVTADHLRKMIEVDSVLRTLGMRVLLYDGGGIRRAAWESPVEFPLMKQVARRLGYDPR
jgi:hypothetical protein